MLGQVIIAVPKDQSQDPGQYIVVREWPNAMELVLAQNDIRCFRPIRVELDGPRPWIVLGRARLDRVLHAVLKYLREDYKRCAVEWAQETIDTINATAEQVQQCLLVSRTGLVGTRIVAHEPYGNQSGEFIVLEQDDRILVVISTDIYTLGRTRIIPIRDKGAWHISQISPGVNELMAIIAKLKTIGNTETEQGVLSGYLDKMMRGQP